MSYCIAIDESGDINHCTRYFSMAAVIVRRYTDLRPAWKSFDDMVGEGKFYGSGDERRLDVIKSIASCKMRAVCVTVDKEGATGPFKGVYGKDLYLRTFEELMSMVGDIACGSDIDIAMDQQRFVKTEVLRDAAQRMAVGCNVKKCDKKVSTDDRAIQVADFVVGAVNHRYSNDDSRYYDMLSEKIVIARMY